MTSYRIEVEGRRIDPGGPWELTWLDRPAGIARLVNGDSSHVVVVEGSGTQWHVVIRGRRVPVVVRTHREQLMAEAEVEAQAHGGPVDIRATLPGLVVAVSVEAGTEVSAGDSLVTIEAMKMQNEVRAPRDGRVAQVSVAPGQPVASGSTLLRLE